MATVQAATMFDQHSLDPFPGLKVSARAWGNVIHHLTRESDDAALDEAVLR